MTVTEKENTTYFPLNRSALALSSDTLYLFITPMGFFVAFVWVMVVVGGAVTLSKRKSAHSRSQIMYGSALEIETLRRNTIADEIVDAVHMEDETTTCKAFLKTQVKHPITAFKQFLQRLPRRVWSFNIDAFLIPAYRPEWGIYQNWTYRMPEIKKMNGQITKSIEIKQRYSQRKMSGPTPHDHSLCERVKFNVNGRIFETQRKTLSRYPETLLGDPTRLEQFYDPDNGYYFFDRMPASFEAILFFFQSGGYLRRPENIYLDIFVDDIEFYDLPRKVLEAFKLEEGLGGGPIEEEVMPKDLLQRKIWLLFDYPESSIQARVVAIFSVFVVVVSLVIFIVETLPEFRFGGTGDDSDDTKLDLRDPFFFTETVCSIWFTLEYFIRFAAAPHKIQFLKGMHNIIDLMSVIPFYVAISSVATTNSMGGGRTNEHSNTNTQSLGVFRIIRLVRVFRIFKLSRHSIGLKILGLTLRSSVGELALLVFFVFLGVIMYSSCLYFVESTNPDSPFQSIPEGFWFTVVTMTTVGFGDDVPVTDWGRIVGAFCAITGVLTIALPVPVIVSNFNYYYHQSIGEQELTITKLHHVDNCPFRPAGDEGNWEEEGRPQEPRKSRRKSAV